MKRPIVVAECGINHNGDVELAKAMIAVAAANGADYVKFQKRDPDHVYSKSYLDRARRSPWGPTVRDEKQGLEFGAREYDQIDAACKAHGIGWFASVWDVDSVRFVLRYDVPFLKLSSACLTHRVLVEAVAASGPPIIISTGMSTEAVLEHCIGELAPSRRLSHILHCVALYPCRSEQMQMSRMHALRGYAPASCKIGFSNHYPGTLFCLQAAIMGAQMIEIHFTLDKTLRGPDHAASLGPAELSSLMRDLRGLEVAWGKPEVLPTPAELEKGAHYKWRATS